MRKRKRDIRLLVLLLVILFSINYLKLDNYLGNFLDETDTAHIDRVIDGDTVESNSTSIRLLGINTPERGEFLYQEAKGFLETRDLNETVVLKYGKDKKDRYGRTLAYIFLNDKNIDLELVENGFANHYFPSGRDIYYEDFLNAWKICIDRNVNLCEKSTNICSTCINLNSKSSIINNCAFDCNISGWKIKAEGRNKTVFQEETLGSLEEISFQLPLTRTGDTIFLWDNEGKLVLWEIY